MLGDLITGTFASGSKSTGVHTMLTKADDYYNELKYKCYIYEGTNIGEERVVSDWVNATNTLSFSPDFTAAIDNTSDYELHRICSAAEYLSAINQAIDFLGDRYLIPLVDETTIRLTSTEDNLGDTVYTWEYSLPTTMIYLHQVTTEDSIGGIKLTGTVSGAFTAGETITGGTSGATGELTYGPAGGTYIRVRKVDGTFVTGETATGGTSEETCSDITAVESETAGMRRWLPSGIIDERDWDIVKTYPSGTPELRLDKDHYYINEDLYLRLDGQRRQPILSSDTDVCYLPPDWVCSKAITFLPLHKMQSNKLDSVLAQARVDSSIIPRNWPHPKARKCVE